jgi:hypothetical protein
MCDLNFSEKSTWEVFLGMKSGYVMDFSDRTFQEFVHEATGIDILSPKYNYNSGSKANRLRAFWKEESNFVVGKLLKALLNYWLTKVQSGVEDYYPKEDIYKSCLSIAERIQKDDLVENIDSLKPNIEEKDFELVARSIRESVEKNEPELALDRLHTFMVKYVRQLCQRHNLTTGKDEPLHSIFGKYVKHLRDNNLMESTMSEKILKSSISVLDAFNDVRNNKSLAHDNPTLNYHESLLILNNISNTIKFIDTIENKPALAKETLQSDESELPF